MLFTCVHLWHVTSLIKSQHWSLQFHLFLCSLQNIHIRQAVVAKYMTSWSPVLCNCKLHPYSPIKMKNYFSGYKIDIFTQQLLLQCIIWFQLRWTLVYRRLAVQSYKRHKLRDQFHFAKMFKTITLVWQEFYLNIIWTDLCVRHDWL